MACELDLTGGDERKRAVLMEDIVGSSPGEQMAMGCKGGKIPVFRKGSKVVQ